MFMELELALLARDTIAEVAPVVERHVPGCTVTSDDFDATVVTPPGIPLPRETAYAIARELRGGRDVDASLPSDWHVRSLGEWPHTYDDGSRRPGPASTALWLCHSLSLPEGYDETGMGADPIHAPGVTRR